MTKFLTKACKCAYCGDDMRVGEAFVWRERSRSVTRHGRSHTGAPQAGYIDKVASYQPCHPHDCLTAKIEAANIKRADELCAMLAVNPAITQDMLNEMRAEIIAGRA